MRQPPGGCRYSPPVKDWGRRYWWLVLLFVCAVVGVWFLVADVAVWLVEGHQHMSRVERASAVSQSRQMLGYIVLGAAGAGTLLYTAFVKHPLERAGHQLELDANATDRYTRAVEQLGSNNDAAQLGGIYALERLAGDSSRDRDSIQEVLAAYVRRDPSLAESVKWAEQFQRKSGDVATREDVPVKLQSQPETLRAALSVLSRHSKIAGDSRYTWSALTDLRGLKADFVSWPGFDLRGMDLSGASFKSADLARSNLRGSKLHGYFRWADLSEAYLQDTDMGRICAYDATLYGADMTRALLTEATLGRAALYRAVLTSAQMTKADLRGADVREADFKDADVTDVMWTFRTSQHEEPWCVRGLREAKNLDRGHIPSDQLPMLRQHDQID